MFPAADLRETEDELKPKWKPWWRPAMTYSALALSGKWRNSNSSLSTMMGETVPGGCKGEKELSREGDGSKVGGALRKTVRGLGNPCLAKNLCRCLMSDGRDSKLGGVVMHRGVGPHSTGAWAIRLWRGGVRTTGESTTWTWRTET